MKRSFPSENDKKRFGGTLRHYHRAGGGAPRTWEEWVDGDAPRSKFTFKWFKYLVILAALFALAGIIVGLYIELS